MRVKCLAQEHSTMTRQGFEPGPLDPVSDALTIRPSLLLDSYIIMKRVSRFKFLYRVNL